MSDELDHDSTHELQALAVQLGDHDWRMVMEAAQARGRAGQAGIDAVLWGLSHPYARVRRGCAGFLEHNATDACFPQMRWMALHDPAAKVRRVAVHSATCQQCIIRFTMTYQDQSHLAYGSLIAPLCLEAGQHEIQPKGKLCIEIAVHDHARDLH
jgi:hypothetical protein